MPTDASHAVTASLNLLRHAEAPYGKVWSQFAEAVVNNDEARMEQHSPWTDHAEACVETWKAPTMDRYVPQRSRVGRAAGGSPPPKPEDADTQTLVQAWDEHRERMQLQGGGAPEYWDTASYMSGMSWGAAQDLPGKPSGSSMLVPLLAAGAIAAFVVTR